MKLITYRSSRGPRVAGVEGSVCVDLNDADSSIPADMKGIMALMPGVATRAPQAMAAGKRMPLTNVDQLPPVPDPEKIICVGLNYADHAKETGAEKPPEPVLFNKLPSAISGDWCPIVLPSWSEQVDYEAELVAVIGRGGRYIPRERARQHIGGYTCGNDVSARDWQLHKPGGQWLMGKSFDTFAPIGPALVTPDDIPDPDNLQVQLLLNGQIMQSSTTAQLIFSVEYLIAYISGICTLSPGDLIFTGTPGGVGMARKPPVWLQPGDTVEVRVERIGMLCNPVKGEGG